MAVIIVGEGHVVVLVPAVAAFTWVEEAEGRETPARALALEEGIFDQSNRANKKKKEKFKTSQKIKIRLLRHDNILCSWSGSWLKENWPT